MRFLQHVGEAATSTCSLLAHAGPMLAHLLVLSWPSLASALPQLGPILAHPGPILAPSRLILTHLGFIIDHRGPILDHLSLNFSGLTAPRYPCDVIVIPWALRYDVSSWSLTHRIAQTWQEQEVPSLLDSAAGWKCNCEDDGNG